MDREEALKAVKERVAYYERDKRLKAAIETLIPELAESDDERVRKNCIHFLELQKSHHASTVEIDECISWLKDKEGLEPVDWRKTKINGKQVSSEPNCVNIPASVEWSKEDDEMVEEIKNIVFGAGSLRNGIRGKIHDWLYNRLKYLCPAKQEWSEEDERNLRNLESILYYDKKLSEETRVELANFLKSIRPSWKPSEEQMRALNKVVNGEVLLTTQHKSLESLCEQLRKLV